MGRERVGALAPPDEESLKLFVKELDENRYDFCKLAYIIWPFGIKGTELEHADLTDWQYEELAALSSHLGNPVTRFMTYRLCVSSGNGARKTALGAMINIMLMYTQQLKGRITANTDVQLKTIVWPEYDKWFRLARFSEHYFDKFGTSIKAKNASVSNTWRLDCVNWSEESPTSISGLHNEGKAVSYTFEEAAGIPSKIWTYASGAFTEKGTIKIFMAFANSDDPESQFEQNMTSPDWRSRRIDTRTLDYIDEEQIQSWLRACGGDEDHDDFRVRVRGLPRKSSKDAIISHELIEGALNRRHDFDTSQVRMLPVIIGCDPAWRGGDETCIWYRQGHYCCLLERYKLSEIDSKATHMYTYNRLVHWERTLKADAVNLDQAEGTGIYTLAVNAGKDTWFLVAFGSSPNDKADPKDSEYANMRAMMYYNSKNALLEGAILDAMEEKDTQDIQKQLSWTKGDRHKISGKKLAEPKKEIRERVGRSPDVADGFVLLFARPVLERRPENNPDSSGHGESIGEMAFTMPEHSNPYEEDDYDTLYNKTG